MAKNAAQTPFWQGSAGFPGTAQRNTPSRLYIGGGVCPPRKGCRAHGRSPVIPGRVFSETGTVVGCVTVDSGCLIDDVVV